MEPIPAKPSEKIVSPTWPVFMSKFIGSKVVAERTASFSFEKPQEWNFDAGQFVDITLLSPPETDSEGNTRGFSVSSAPSEMVITITTRLRDTAFKRVISNMSIGTTVKIEGPFGNLRLHRDLTKPAVALCGGIGITPFRSMIVESSRTHGHLQHKIILFLVNRTSADAPFLNELTELSLRDPNLILVPVMTKQQDLTSEYGHVNVDMIRRHVSDLQDAIWYITGPQAFVRSIRGLVASLNVHADDIRMEEFTGY